MACNPTVQYNDFTGNGSTTAYTFTFPYDNTTDVQVRLGTYPNYTYPTYTTEYAVDSANPTIVNFVTAPTGPIRIFRCTPNTSLPATFQPGSAIRSSDLNNNFNQTLYVIQDANIRSVDSQAVADTAYVQSNTAITTANGAVTTANTALTTANTASATASSAQSAVAAAILYDPVANIAAIPGSPSNDTYVEISDSTGIESFSPLSGLPSGFIGSSGLTVRIRYQTNTWTWQQYFASDPDSRYFSKTSGETNATNIATKMPLAGGTFTGAVSLDDNVIIRGDSSNGSGKLTLNCENNSHGVHIKGPPHSAGATYTLTLPNNTGTSGQFLATNGSGVMSWSTMTQILVADGGNFDSGSSLVTSSSTYDGGSFD